jgi:hypothetical protein
VVEGAAIEVHTLTLGGPTEMAPDLTSQHTFDGLSRTGCPPNLCRTQGVKINGTLTSAGPHAGHKLGIAKVITGRSRPSPLMRPTLPGRRLDYLQAGHFDGDRQGLMSLDEYRQGRSVFVVTMFEPSRYRAGVERISFTQHSLEGGGFDREMTAPADAVVHAEWSGSPRRPPAQLYATTSNERHEAWCGARLRLILAEPFNRGSVKASPACLDAFRRGYPHALMPK